MKDIEKQVPGVKFVRVLKDSDAVIRIAFNHEHPHGKTWSRVGREAERFSSSEATMNLSGVTGHESDDIQEDSKEYGDIMHELLHALGMHHEHQHPDRTFHISPIAAKKDLEDDGWSERDINDNVVRRFSPNRVGAHSRPDMASCMNYSIPGEWTKDGTEVQKSDKPSDLDFAWLNLMYPPCDPTKFDQALSESMDPRISMEHKDSILKLYSDGDWDRMRSRIANISNPESKSWSQGVWGKILDIFALS